MSTSVYNSKEISDIISSIWDLHYNDLISSDETERLLEEFYKRIGSTISKEEQNYIDEILDMKEFAFLDGIVLEENKVQYDLEKSINKILDEKETSYILSDEEVRLLFNKFGK